MVDRARIGRNNRRKGAAFEREVVRAITKMLPDGYWAARRLQNRGGTHEPDVGVFITGSLWPVWHIECKTGRHVSLDKAVEQARRQACKYARIAVVIRKYRQQPVAYVVHKNNIEKVGNLDYLAAYISAHLRGELLLE